MNEFYYYDGESFQKCLTLSNIKVPINNDYEDLAFFISDNRIEIFLTVGKIEKKCLYDLENVKAHFHILTDRGFELIMTETMNVRAAGLDTKDFIDITVKPVLLVCVNEKLNINKLNNLKEINTYEISKPIVRMVPRSDVTDILDFKKLELSETLRVNEDAAVIFTNNINNDIVETLNLKRITLKNLISKEGIKILLNEIEI